MRQRILHIDMDAFFASVEQARNPALRGKPLIIGGSKEDLRGVVSTASYEARKYGVRSAMPLSQAKRLCPNGIYMRGNHALYGEVSRQIHTILARVSPIIQMASIDEAYMDVSGSLGLFGGDGGIARHIKDEVKRETGLTCTIAISGNKLVSKIGSDLAKPDGYLCIEPGGEADFLAPLPVRKMPGVGPRCHETLERLGIRTLGELAAAPLPPLERRFGLHTALSLQQSARGEFKSEVTPNTDPKSISRETTFPEDVSDWETLERTLAQLLERCTYSLRKHGLEAKRITLKVRYQDFETRTFAKSLPEYSCIDQVFTHALAELLPKARTRRDKVRLVGVGISQLAKGQHQLSLFDAPESEKWERALRSMDALRGKHGHNAVRFGRGLEKD